jgi:hypothetical protein
VAAAILAAEGGIFCGPEKRWIAGDGWRIVTSLGSRTNFPPGWEARLYGRHGCLPLH